MSKLNYIKFIRELKEEILQSRYVAAKLVNKELLILYFKIGKLLSEKTTNANWGDKVLDTISNDLQKEFPGLRGFSRSNLANMKQFYSAYSTVETIQDKRNEIVKNTKKKQLIQSPTGLIFPYFIGDSEGQKSKKTTKISPQQLVHFFSVSFTHHIKILNNTTAWDERLFYIQKASENQWSVDILENQLECNYFHKQGKQLNNFKKTLPKKLQNTAISSFKDEYLLDFLNIYDKDNPDEREIEEAIIKNIRSFILSLGKEFAFIGNQYRIVFEEEEYFVDLLFYHRGLQSLVAIDLKRGKFKPEYAGKMNFYLNVLNDQVRLPHENPSIGIILCKEKKDSTVEYSFKDINKPIGVSKYKIADKLPAKLKKYLPEPDDLIQILKEPEIYYGKNLN